MKSNKKYRYFLPFILTSPWTNTLLPFCRWTFGWNIIWKVAMPLLFYISTWNINENYSQFAHKLPEVTIIWNNETHYSLMWCLFKCYPNDGSTVISCTHNLHTFIYKLKRVCMSFHGSERLSIIFVLKKSREIVSIFT